MLKGNFNSGKGFINTAARNALSIAVGAVSFSLLAYEVMIPRLLSVVLSYHFVFAVLSLSILGLALGGLITHLLRLASVEKEESGVYFLKLFGALCSASVSGSLLGVVAISNLDVAKGDVLWYVLPTTVPYVIGGAFLAALYGSFPNVVAWTYGADLVGAAIGAVGAVVLMDFGGAVGPTLFLGVVSSAGVLTLLFVDRGRLLNKANVAPILSFGFCVTVTTADYLGCISLEVSPGRNPQKEMYESLTVYQGRIIETRWTSFGRTDLVAYPERHHMDFYLDGTAGSPMYRVVREGIDNEGWVSELENFVGYFPLKYLGSNEKNKSLVIGPGGGRDVLLGRLAGVKKIVAVEVNADIVNIARKYEWYNGGLYNNENDVQVVIQEGRSYMRRQNGTFDVIMMSLPVTNTSRSIEGFSLTENYLFTVESIGDYLGCLAENGRLIVVAHNDIELLRLLLLTLKAFALKGVKTSEAMGHIWVVSSGDYLALVVKKSPFERKECFAAYREAVRLGYRMEESFFPFLPVPSGVNRSLVALERNWLTVEDLISEVRMKGFDIRPVWDNNPFFYKFETGLPTLVGPVASSALSVLVVITVMFILWLRKRSSAKRSAGMGEDSKGLPLRFTLMFFVIGIGFICVEVSLTQRFCLVFGEPVLTTAFVVSSILLCGGAGSVLVGEVKGVNLDRWIRLACGGVALGIFASEVIGEGLIKVMLPWPREGQIALAFLSVAPIGMLMGIPFPLGVRALKKVGWNEAVPWMWCFNGVASVIGACLAVSVATEFGFRTVLLTCACCYSLVFLLFRDWKLQVFPFGKVQGEP